MTTATRKTARRETPKTTRSGSCRWPAGNADAKARLEAGVATAFRITTDTGATDYFVMPMPGVGFRLIKIGDDECTAYDLPATCTSCGCPDHKHRRVECKHIRALRAGLRVLGLLS